MFHVRVLSLGTPLAPVSILSQFFSDSQWYEIVFRRAATGDKFGETPRIGILLKVEHKDYTVYENEHVQIPWYDKISTVDKEPGRRVKDNSTEDGYQYQAVEVPFNDL